MSRCPLISLVGVPLAAAVLLAACAGSGARAQTSFLVLSEGVPTGLDQDGPGTNYPPSQAGIINLMEPLVQYKLKAPNAEGLATFDFENFAPGLAESWTFDAPSVTWTLKLRPDVKSCAGNPLTADDVVYTFARAKSLTGSPIGFTIGSSASVAGFTPDLFAKTPEAMAKRALGDEVKKIDEHTVQIRQSAPNRLFLPGLTNLGLLVFDAVEMKKNATADDPWSHSYANTVNTPGFGPYCLESWQKEQEFVVKANPAYWAGKPAIDRIVVRRVPQSSNRVAVLRSGGAQIAEGLSPKEFDNLRTAKGVKVMGETLNATAFMLMSYKINPFDNLKLRQAIAYAVPYPDIIKSAYFGQAQQWLGLVPSRYPGYHASDTTYSFDLAKAKDMLAEAGFPEGKGLEAFPDSFKLAYAAERESVLGPMVTLLRTRLRQIGIPLQLDPIPASQMSNRFLVQRDLPIGIWDTGKPFLVDAGFTLALWYLSPPRGLNNMSNYSNADVDRLFDLAKNESDVGKRNLLLGQAQDVLMRTLPFVPVAEAKLQFAVQDGVSGLTLHPSQQLSWKYLTR